MIFPKNRFQFAFADAVVVEEKLRDIEVGTVQSVSSDSSPSVTVRQSDDKIYLDFSIPKGRDGENGADGRDGNDGIDGRDGIDGTNGRNGRDGRDGQDGADGRDGIDGESVTVDSELSDTSENPVQNKVIKAALDEKFSTPPGTPTPGQVLIYGATRPEWATLVPPRSTLEIQESSTPGIADHAVGDILNAYYTGTPTLFRMSDSGPYYLSRCERAETSSSFSLAENYDVTNRANRDVPVTISKSYTPLDSSNASLIGAVAAHKVFIDGYTNPAQSSFVSMPPFTVVCPEAGNSTTTITLSLSGAVSIGFDISYVAFKVETDSIANVLDSAQFDLFCEINPSIRSAGHTQMGVFVWDSLDVINSTTGVADFASMINIGYIGNEDYTDYRTTPCSFDLTNAITQLNNPSEMYIFLAMFSSGNLITRQTDETLSGYRTNYGARFFGFDISAHQRSSDTLTDTFNIEFTTLTSPQKKVIKMLGKTNSYNFTTETVTSEDSSVMVNIEPIGGVPTADKEYSDIAAAVNAGIPVTVKYDGRLYSPSAVNSDSITFVSPKSSSSDNNAVLTIDSSEFVGTSSF